ncbi:MAG: hypothetical protein K1X28_10130 [Parachlamydiales bacterium]|nr:hypothetical protein [Parachlamydiales bacterium]
MASGVSNERPAGFNDLEPDQKRRRVSSETTLDNAVDMAAKETLGSSTIHTSGQNSPSLVSRVTIYASSASSLEEAVHLDPFDLERGRREQALNLLNRGRSLFDQEDPSRGDLKSAIEAFRQASVLDISDTTLKANILLWLGISLLNQDHVSEEDARSAIGAFRQASALNISETDLKVEIWEWLGMALRDDGNDLDGAIVAFRKSCAHAIGNNLYKSLKWTNLGNALKQRCKEGDLDEAINAYQIACALSSKTLDPLDIIPIWNNLGNAFLKRDQPGDLDGAIDAFQKASALDCPLTLLKLACLDNLAFALEKRNQPGDLDKAIEAYEQASLIEIDDLTHQSIRWNNLAYALSTRGKPEDLIKAAKLLQEHLLTMTPLSEKMRALSTLQAIFNHPVDTFRLQEIVE